MLRASYIKFLIEFIQKELENSNSDNYIFWLLSISSMIRYRYAIFENYSLESKKFEYLIDITLKSNKYLNTEFQKEIKEYKTIFIDSFGWSTRGLSFQYLYAELKKNKNCLYIYCGKDKPDKKFLDLIKEYKSNYLLLKPINRLKDLKKELKRVNCLSCDEIIFHVKPWSITEFIYGSCIKSKRKSLIDLTDHSFCLGFELIDNVYSWRSWGINILKSSRQIKTNCTVVLNKLPIPNDLIDFKKTDLSDSFFDKSKFNIFCGGNLEKVYGNNYDFLGIMKDLVEIDPSIRILIAGLGEKKPLLNFIKKNKLSEKIKYIGFRNDLGNVIDNCDIVLATSPIGGGIISQLAIYLRKPILSLIDKDLPMTSTSMMCDIDLDSAVYTKKDLENNLRRLVSDKDYLKSLSNDLIKYRYGIEDFCLDYNNKKYINLNEYSLTIKNIHKYIENQSNLFVQREYVLLPYIFHFGIKLFFQQKMFYKLFKRLLLLIYLSKLYSFSSYIRSFKFIIKSINL